MALFHWGMRSEEGSVGGVHTGVHVCVPRACPLPNEVKISFSLFLWFVGLFSIWVEFNFQSPLHPWVRVLPGRGNWNKIKSLRLNTKRLQSFELQTLPSKAVSPFGSQSQKREIQNDKQLFLNILLNWYLTLKSCKRQCLECLQYEIWSKKLLTIWLLLSSTIFCWCVWIVNTFFWSLGIAVNTILAFSLKSCPA